MPRQKVGSILLILTVLGTGAALGARKYSSLRAEEVAAALQPEPMESISSAAAEPREYRGGVTSIGTVLAIRSVVLRNELAGTVSQVALTPGQIVDAGTVLVALDVSVEQADLLALQAQAQLAQTILDRNQQASEGNAVSQVEVDRARAERDVALAQVERTKAVIARKTIRAPFRARIGLSDVHTGQYLSEGTEVTTLQGVDEAVHVDFAVPQHVALGLKPGARVEVAAGGGSPVAASIVAVDAKIDPLTRNALVRARLEGSWVAPGSSVRVEVPDGPAVAAVAIPASALRKGPAGDHVFVIATGPDGSTRAHVREVKSGPVLGEEVLILEGLEAGEQVATSGSFKLREGVLVAAAGNGGQ